MIRYIEGLFLTWEKFWEHILPNLRNLLYLDLTLIDINQSHTISYHGDHWNNLYRKAIVQWSAWLVILVFQEYSSWIADEVMYWKIDRYCSTSQQCQPGIQKSHEKKIKIFLVLVINYQAFKFPSCLRKYSSYLKKLNPQISLPIFGGVVTFYEKRIFTL